MNQSFHCYAGIDWATAKHQACVLDGNGKELGNASFPHSGSGLTELCDWILTLSGTGPQHVGVGIETPQGPVVETLQEHGFLVHSINPRQADRFRDRLFPAGSKDDRRDAWVLASALRTDPQAFRELQPPDPLTLQLREYSRITDDLTRERVRLTNRLRSQLWRYYPQMLEVSQDLAEGFFLDLWEAAPTPARAARITRPRIAGILKANRIRRIGPDRVKEILTGRALDVAPGTEQAAVAAITLLVERLRLVKRQLRDVGARIDDLLARYDDDSAEEPGQRDAEILRSIPGVGRLVLATLLSEAHDPIRRRDYQALRAHSGVAPVTRRSGKGIIVTRRRAANQRLVNALAYWAVAALRNDSASRAKYDALRARGHGHMRALRSVADRLIYVACAMLANQTPFDPSLRSRGQWQEAS